MAKKPRDGVVRTTVSFNALVFVAAERRSKELECASLTEYFEALVRDDYKGKKPEIGAKYNMEELRDEARKYIEAASRQRDRDRAAKKMRNEAKRSNVVSGDFQPKMADFWDSETLAAGFVTGAAAENRPDQIEVPSDFKLPVDFVVPVFGDSMTGVIEGGNWAACIYSHDEEPRDKQVVVAIIKGQAVIKRFERIKGAAWFVSTNPDYPPIRATATTKIQGFFSGIFPNPSHP